MKNRPSATGDLVAATPSQEKASKSSKRGQRSKGGQKLDPLCDVRYAVKGMVVLDEAKASQFIRKDCIENTFILDEKPFASGLFATVRRVRDKTSGVTYAAKYAARDRYGVDSTADIMHELGLLSVCAPCPRIVRLHAAFDTRPDLILVMDYASGGDMQTILDTDIIPFEHDAARFTKQLMEALVFLHDKNIVHLDIKPQNLVLTGPFPDCDIKLCDLEISRVVTEDETIREILGTPDYVAPEILHFEPISLAADIWSTGVLAYVLLTGFTPFGGDTDQETFCNISKCQVDFPNELFEDVSDIAKDFINRLLVRTPRDRPHARECLRYPWLNSNRKGAAGHQKETIASEAQKRHHLSGGGCPRSSSSLQHLALQRHHLTKSREVLSERVASLSNLRKSTSKSRERLCEMRLSLSRSRDHLFDIQRAMSGIKDGMGLKILSRSQEVLSHKLNSLNNSRLSEGNAADMSSSRGMSFECIPPLISPHVDTPSEPSHPVRGQSVCESCEVLSQPLVEVPEEDDENQEKPEVEVHKDDSRKDQSYHLNRLGDQNDQSQKTDFSDVDNDRGDLKVEPNQCPSDPIANSAEILKKNYEELRTEVLNKHFAEPVKTEDNRMAGNRDKKLLDAKHLSGEKEIEAKNLPMNPVLSVLPNNLPEVKENRADAVPTVAAVVVTENVTPVSNVVERKTTDSESDGRRVLNLNSGEKIAEKTTAGVKNSERQNQASSAQKTDIAPLVRKTSRHDLVLKIDTPPTTPTTVPGPPSFNVQKTEDRELEALSGIEATPPAKAESMVMVEEQQTKPLIPPRPKRPPPLEMPLHSLPIVPSPIGSAAEIPDDPGTPRAYFLEKLRSFRDKLTQSIQRQNSDNAKPTSQPTSPLSEVSNKTFVETVPEDDQKIPHELLSRRRASWAHGLRQESQPEQKPSVAKLVQAFVGSKNEASKELSFIEPRKLRTDWRKSESTESLNEKPEKPAAPEVRKLRQDWRKLEDENSERADNKMQEEEKPSKPIASIALVFEMATAALPQVTLTKAKVPLTPPVRRKNSFERSRPAHLMAEVLSLPKLVEVASPREEEEPFLPKVAQEAGVTELPESQEVKEERPKSQEVKVSPRKKSLEKNNSEPGAFRLPTIKISDLLQQSTSQKLEPKEKKGERKKMEPVVPFRKKKDKSQESNDVFSQTLDIDFSLKGESCAGTTTIDTVQPVTSAPEPEQSSATSKHIRSGSVSSDTGCSELSSDALSDRSSSASAGNWEDGERKSDKKTAETQTTSLEDVSEKAEWRGRNRSHSVQADLSFLAQPWGRVCTGSVARAFEKFGSKSNEKSTRSFRIRRQSTFL